MPGARCSAISTTFATQPEAARRGYEDWWEALEWIRDGLLAGGTLREVEVTATMPKERPWKL